jgi:hypothetical protein
MKKTPKLSIIILSYNTKDLLINCLKSLEKVKKEVSFEVIVVDNASTDGSAEAVKLALSLSKGHPELAEGSLKLIQNKSNLGFARGNNSARKTAKGKHILFLNSDTQVKKNTLKRSVEYLDNHKEVAALTVRTLLPNGKDDRDARRSFPTPWVALTHFAMLDRIFPKSKIFSKYWYGYISPDKSHEIDVAQGAYLLVKKELLDEVNWFSEEYFLDGEDIDLCWKIKTLGYKIYYLADAEILHIKKASKKKNKSQSVSRGVDSMEIFYKKHLSQKYPLYINILVLIGIKKIKLIRLIKHTLTVILKLPTVILNLFQDRK